ncbi:MAG: phosphoenolpyruvate--protein phosphotransferase [Nitrospinota bacterium]
MDEHNIYKGIAASHGIVMGRAYLQDSHMICAIEHHLKSSEDVSNEVTRFLDKVEECSNEIAQISNQAKEVLGDETPLILVDAHRQILHDPSMQKKVVRIIEDHKCNAEWALKILREKYVAKFSKFKDPYFHERLNDIEQAITKLQRYLSGEDIGSPLDNLEEPVIVIAHNLTPSDTLKFDRQNIIGFAIDSGGKTSHVGILASSMDIPAVVGLKNISSIISSGDPIVLDGIRGEIIHKPSKQQFELYNKYRQRWLYFDEDATAQKDLDAITTDGIKINVQANIETTKDIDRLDKYGAGSVGLFRTEYIFINDNSWPDEENQYEQYKKLATILKGDNFALVRTLDIGADKLHASAPYFDDEANPALGLRAIRFCLQNVDIFKTQIKAILRAAIHGNLKIMFPLITAVEELIEANKIVELSKSELRAAGKQFKEDIETGVMIETPSAVILARELSNHCSFFSIGTNDLIQFSMAIDRANEKVAYLYQPLSPAILRLVASVIKIANETNTSVSICGEMAQDPLTVIILLGLGDVKSLSMDVHSIARIKKFIREISISEAQALATKVINLDNTEEIIRLVKSEVADYIKDDVSSKI